MKNAFYYATSSGYEIGAHALLNSILTHDKENNDIIILYKKDCISYINWLKEQTIKYNKNRNFKFIQTENNDDVSRTRFNVLKNLINDYDTICMLDADMFLTANWDNLFKISNNTNLLVGVRDFSARRYNEKYFSSEYGKHLFKNKSTIYQEEFLCTVPFFFNKINKSLIDTHCTLQDNIKECSDMDILNLAICIENKMNLIHAMPADIFTEVHFTFMSPFTRLCVNYKEKDVIYKDINNANYIIKGDHYQKYFSLHGKFWSKQWTDGMRKTFDSHLNVSYNINDEKTKCILNEKANQALDSAIKLFIYYLNIEIPLNLNTIQKKDNLNV